MEAKLTRVHGTSQNLTTPVSITRPTHSANLAIAPAFDSGVIVVKGKPLTAHHWLRVALSCSATQPLVPSTQGRMQPMLQLDEIVQELPWAALLLMVSPGLPPKRDWRVNAAP